MIRPPFTTLLEALSPAAPGVRRRESVLTFVDDDDAEAVRSLASIRGDAVRFAHALRAAGVAPGDRVPIVLPTSPEFVVAFFGALYAGAWPAPLGLPGGFGDLENFSRRMGVIGKYLGARHVITNAGLRDYALAPLPGATFVDGAIAGSSEPIADTGELPPITAEDVALLQCTSGSTGVPKGVMLSHRNLLVNCAQIGVGVDVKSDDVVVTWLPLNHDMGIIGCVLFAITWGLDLVLLSPSKFLRRPSSWLRAISRHKGTLSPAPNFAYGYLTARVKEDEIAGCDLSSWRVAFCGAEPIDADTLLKFEECFKRFGLRNDVVLPCYGLAEASLAVTFHPHGTPLRYDEVDRDALAGGEAKKRDGYSHVSSSTIVSCGRPLKGTEVRIVGADGADLPELRVGRVHVKGPSVMRGYLDLPEKTAEVIHDGWLDTGDLGYVRGGELYITGREKDVIIIRGKCYVPTDFEWAAAEVPGVREGAVVAFGVFDAFRGTELLHLVCETEVKDEAGRARLRAEVEAQVAKRCGLRPDVVHFVRRYAIPKTTSGKLQRAKTKQAYLEERPSRTWRAF